MKKPDLRKPVVEDKNVLNRVNLRENAENSKGNIMEIIKGDFRSAFKNPIVLLILIAVIILPSLYGLVNIYACWDPYEETGNVPFAIANEDQGATYQDLKVYAGNDLIDSLRENKDFKWEFVTSDELQRGVHNGTYYAGMIIPANFSESVVSIASDNPHSADLIYIVNEKTNPVAAKLTDAAAKTVYNKLNAEIVSFISVAAHDKLGELQAGLSSGASEMEDGADQLSAGADKVAAGADKLTAGANQVTGGANQLAGGSKQVSNGATAVAVGANRLSSGADQLASGASEVSDGTHQIATRVDNVADIIHKIIHALENGGDVAKLSDDINELNYHSSKLAEDLNLLDKSTDDVNYDAYKLSNDANYLASETNKLSNQASLVSNGTHNVSQEYNDVSNDINELAQRAKNGESPSKIKELLELIDGKVTNVTNKIDTLDNGAGQVANGSASVASGANDLKSGAYQVADGANQVSEGAYTLANGVQILSDGTIKLAAGAELLGDSAADALYTASASLFSASDQLSGISGLSDEQVGDFFYSPVKLQRQEEFPTNNYGSQVAPFYLVLSMWVGALITAVMLKTGSSIGTKYKPHEIYMGKLFLFNIMAILQTTVTIIGCYILGIDISNHLMFMFSCYFVAIIFISIIYSFISLFGDVGKGIAILLLVFQISGSGGIYPIEIMNEIFGQLYPYLPMTHGINIVREAQLGLIWSNYLPSFAFLLILGVIVVLLSVILKQRWDKRTKYFDDKLEESNLFN